MEPKKKQKKPMEPKIKTYGTKMKTTGTKIKTDFDLKYMFFVLCGRR